MPICSMSIITNAISVFFNATLPVQSSYYFADQIFKIDAALLSVLLLLSFPLPLIKLQMKV